jgi:hypothetical protein
VRPTLKINGSTALLTAIILSENFFILSNDHIKGVWVEHWMQTYNAKFTAHSQAGHSMKKTTLKGP